VKALFMVTGRGIGGDATIAFNISKTLSKYGVRCEFALDHSAVGLLFEKKGIKWHKTGISQAGGHAATKFSLIMGGFRTIKGVFEAIKLYRRLHPDVVVGSIGGGAVIGCLAAKISNIPSVGIVATPYDSKIIPKITTVIALPESPLFKLKIKEKNIHKAYLPVNPEIITGDKQKARKLMPEDYDEALPTILISSGSMLFEKMAYAASKIVKSRIDANIVVVGHTKDEYLKYLKMGEILYLGYVNWMHDLYQLADLAILSDDGMMVHEAIACNLPTVTLPGVKYGRYHGMAEIFKSAAVEGDLENIDSIIKDILDNIDEMKANASKYKKDVLKSSDKIAGIIYSLIDKKYKNQP